MDSEEEFEELHGEDINSENTKEIEDEEMEEEDETAGWIVPDGYLSIEEVKNGDDEAVEGNKIVRPKWTIETTIKPKIWLYSEMDEELTNYEISILPSKRYQKVIKILSKEEEEEENKVVTVLEQKYLKDLVFLVHGSYENKQTLIETFINDHPDITKTSIEKKMKEIGQKIKINDEQKARFLVNDIFLKDMDLLQQAHKVKVEREEKYLAE